MHVIPVIDVKGGLAVAARGGDRANYRPLETPLAEGSDPLSIARGYRALHPFPVIYIADLDGIEGRGPNLALVRELAMALPEVALWVDNGADDDERVRDLLSTAQVQAVVGSEVGLTVSGVASLTATFPDRVVLSLDFKGDTFLGDPKVLRTPDAWPERIIAMTLARVGENDGPDLARMSNIVSVAGGRHVYAAGGMRNHADLLAARQAAVAGALVATALHTGQITARDLDEVTRP